MVKNTTGGSKAKLQGRKFVNVKATNILRISEDPCEIYAQVTKTLGNGMCHVICLDEKTRLCHIRGKFRGRGKRDNFLGRGTWLLIGLREWESSSESKTDKLQNCDLLEVYNDHDKDRLKNTVRENWSVFVENDGKNSNVDECDLNLEFTDDRTEEYMALLKEQVAKKSSIIMEEDDDEKEVEIDVDDI